jgi:hypothetical protein
MASPDQFRSLATMIDADRARSFSLGMRAIDPDRIAVIGSLKSVVWLAGVKRSGCR